MSEVRRTASSEAPDHGPRTTLPEAHRGRHATVPADRPDEVADEVSDEVSDDAAHEPSATAPGGGASAPLPHRAGTAPRPTAVPEDTVPYAPSRSPSAVVPRPAHAVTADPSAPPAPVAPAPARGRRVAVRVTLGVLVVLVLALGAATVHLYRTSTAWEERAGEYLADARGLGGDLAAERAELAGTRAELDAVRDQLATAHARIVELADEKAQIGDDREVQRQLVDYQQRVSDAAGQVAHALDQCVQGQQQLIGYLQQTVEGTARYDEADLDRFTRDVDALCQAASEANMSLQRELSR